VSDLSHIFFLGEDTPHEVGRERRVQTKAPKAGTWEQKKREASKPTTHHSVSPLLEFILRQSGLDSSAYQPEALNRRLKACLRALRATSEEAAMETLLRRPELLEISLRTILNGVSQFFRDEAVFNDLEGAVLPEIVRQNGAVRAYSAGCSAGQELYSLAILLDELGHLEGSHLLGIDCRREAITQAASGCYNVSELKSVNDGRRRRYFEIEDRQATISCRLRAKTLWGVGDAGIVLDTKHLWDLILFRNVAIYLEPEYANRIWRHLDQQLKPGGVIVTGSADLPGKDLGWSRESACLYRKPLAQTS
jgi:chemotaxis methyl-accepting protein methylase